MATPGSPDPRDLLASGHVEEALAAFAARGTVPEAAVEALRARGATALAEHAADLALTCLDAALALDSSDAETHALRGLALADLGRHADAVASYDQALAISPDHAQALNNRGNALLALARLDAALASYDRALAVRPDYPRALNNRGHCLLALGEHRAALASLERAVGLDPGYAQAWRNRGLAQARGGDPAAALASLDRAIALAPGRVDYRLDKATMLETQGRFVEALDECARAIGQSAGNVEAYYMRGRVQRTLARFEAALASQDAALRLDPRHARAWNDRGIALRELGRPEEALASYARALEIDPEFAQAHWNAALCKLQLGDYAAGWRGFEWRWRLEVNRAARDRFSTPPWLGETSPAGKTVLLHAEQGLGDTLQFCRYVPRLAALGARVLLEADASLIDLLGSLAGVAERIVSGTPIPDQDLHCPLLSLPLAFGTGADDIPAEVPYLAVDTEHSARWRERLGPVSGFRVGLAWRGNPRHEKDARRSLGFAELAAYLPTDLPIEYHSLQREVSAEDLAGLAARGDIRHWGGELLDFSDTAALCDAMDLVISVDTSVAHLAGALAQRVWVLLQFNPDWRWLLHREDSPWYPTARLFRQPAEADWHTPLRQLAEALPLALAAAGQLRGDRQAAELCHSMARALSKRRRHRDALTCLGYVLQTLPESAGAHLSRGMALRGLGELAAALASYDRAILLEPRLATARNNRGNVLADMGRHEEALSAYRDALALAPDYPEAHWNLALRCLLLGRFEEGWREYEVGLGRAGCRGILPPANAPEWRGDMPLAGKTLLLDGEQGYGDVIQFCRYTEAVADLGARVLLRVEPTLVALLGGLSGVGEVIARDVEPAAYDYRCPLLSLPLAFKTEIDTIPARLPYLSAPPERLGAWSARLGPRRRPRLGIVWSGRPSHSEDSRRSLPLAEFASLLDGLDVEIHALQREVRPEDAAYLQGHPAIRDWADALHDFADTAAVCELLDLIVCVDTSVAHLAGALGRPVWILLPHNPDWRWLLERSDSPWYPSARLYRQDRPGDWRGVLARLRADLRRVVEALAGLDRTPDAARAQFELAGRLMALGHASDAWAAYRRAATLKPDAAEAHVGQGIALRALGRHQAALASYDLALALRPALHDAWVCRGNALGDLGRYAEALACHEHVLATRPDDADALVNRGNVLYRLGRLSEALESVERALASRPGMAAAHGNRAMILADLGRQEAALADLEHALVLRLAAAWRGGATPVPMTWPDIERAAESGALELDHELLATLWNRALAYLQIGRFAEGWREFECRHRLGITRLGGWWRGQANWLGGTPLAGRRILLHGEQGLGDVIQFCRYVAQVKQLGAHVSLGIDPSLRGLLSRLPGVDDLVVEGARLPEVDLHCPLMSLPLALHSELAGIPAEIPYLSADPEQVAAWGARLGPRRGLRVGLVWRGNPGHKRDARRSLSLAELRAMLPEGVEYFSLQKDIAEADRAALDAAPAIRHFGEALIDFDATAALCMHMDRVLSVDTSVAHLAGALGRPLGLLLAYNPDWRWLLDRDDSPWYPTARLYRQTAPDDWVGVAERVRADIEALRDADAAARRALLEQAIGLHQAGQSEPAQRAYERVLATWAEDFDALHLLAVLAAQTGRDAEALDLFARALRQRPDPVALANRAALLERLGEDQAALADYRQAADLAPGDPTRPFQYANMLLRLGRDALAAEAYARVVELDPEYVEAHYNQGIALRRLGRDAEALAAYARVLDRQPAHVRARNNRANLLRDLGRRDEALDDYRRAIEIDPGHAEAHANLGLVLTELGRPEEALGYFARALALRPDYAEAYNHRALALSDLGRREAALADYDRALALKPEHAGAHQNRSLLRLQLGQFAPGWAEYEWRWRKPIARKEIRGFTQPLWLGETPLHGKTLLLHGEFGLGDTLQFCRYAPRVAALGARVVLEVDAPLVPLLETLEGVERVLARGQPLPAFDYYCPVMSLPLAFKTDLASIPAPPAYLRADPGRLDAWRLRLGPPRRPRVGIVWSGNPKHSHDRTRSLALASFIAALPEGADYFGLQKHPRPADRARLEEHPEISFLGDQLGDFADTAALCALMDVIVSVDTSVAHLAGALGRPVWILLPYNPDWRWLLERDDSPWYPSARLFRQERPGDWSGVLARVREALRGRVGQ